MKNTKKTRTSQQTTDDAATAYPAIYDTLAALREAREALVEAHYAIERARKSTRAAHEAAYRAAKNPTEHVG